MNAEEQQYFFLSKKHARPGTPTPSINSPLLRLSMSPSIRSRTMAFKNYRTVVFTFIVLILVTLLFWRGPGVDNSKVSYLDLHAAMCKEYSPAYPSANGPGCSSVCQTDPSRKVLTSSYALTFKNATHKWPLDFLHNMHLAGNMLKKYGVLASLDTERESYLHVTFDYYCCYTVEEILKIGEFLDNYHWTPHEIWFDRLVCAIHSPGNMVSIVLMMDSKSQSKLLQAALKCEQDLEKYSGIHKHIPHTKLQGFHMTLATVNQSLFPVLPAIDEINKAIPPGTWSSIHPVILHKPVCWKCQTVRKSLHTIKK